MTIGISQILTGFALTAIGYISDATSQTAEVSERIYTVATLVPGICYLVVFLIMQFWYPLSKHEVEKNAEIVLSLIMQKILRKFLTNLKNI